MEHVVASSHTKFELFLDSCSILIGHDAVPKGKRPNLTKVGTASPSASQSGAFFVVSQTQNLSRDYHSFFLEFLREGELA